MRKWRFTRPAMSPLTTTVLAFVITVAVHALFLLPDYRTPGDDTNSSASSLRTLNISALPADEQQKFRTWLSIHDPARVARSSSPSGYSAALPRSSRIKVEVKNYHLKKIANSIPQKVFSPVAAGRLPEKSLPGLRLPEKENKTLRRAAVFDENGLRIPDMLKELPAGWGSRQVTVVTVTGFGKVSGVSVTQSCGRAEMDRAAQTAAARMNFTGKKVLTVFWPEVEK